MPIKIFTWYFIRRQSAPSFAPNKIPPVASQRLKKISRVEIRKGEIGKMKIATARSLFSEKIFHNWTWDDLGRTSVQVIWARLKTGLGKQPSSQRAIRFLTKYLQGLILMGIFFLTNYCHSVELIDDIVMSRWAVGNQTPSPSPDFSKSNLERETEKDRKVD